MDAVGENKQYAILYSSRRARSMCIRPRGRQTQQLMRKEMLPFANDIVELIGTGHVRQVCRIQNVASML